MAGFNIVPQTITGKVHTRTPTQAQALSSRYTFLNLQNSEPNLGKPGPAGTSPETTEGYLGLRYALLSNNNSNGLSAWRVWSFDNPRVAFYSIQNSLGIGENANPIRINSIVYNNHPYGRNRYNSESLAENSFNVYSLSGIYLFDSTTVGDPASAVSLVVTESGFVGINTEFPNAELTVNGSISARNNATVVGNLDVNGNTNLGNAKTDVNTFRGEVKIADSSINSLIFGDGNSSYDTNLYRLDVGILNTDNAFYCNSLSSTNALTGADIKLTGASVITPSTTASGDFLILNINGTNRAIRLWDY